MGIYYEIYLEGKINGEWRCIDPFLKTASGELKHACIMEGKSMVGMMVDDIGYWQGIPQGVSKEVLDVLPHKYSETFEPTDELDPSRVRWFEISDVRADPARFEHEAYVGREAMNLFELGEIEEIEHWLTPEEYGSLPSDEKRGYTFFRWNDAWGSYRMKCELKEAASFLMEAYRSNVLISEPNYPEIDKVRCIVAYG